MTLNVSMLKRIGQSDHCSMFPSLPVTTYSLPDHLGVISKHLAHTFNQGWKVINVNNEYVWPQYTSLQDPTRYRANIGPLLLRYWPDTK